jgi:hypothetical protein
MKRTHGLFLVVLLAVSLVPAIAQGNPPAADKSEPAALPQANNATYIIGGDDMLAIHVWKEPDLTTTLPVRADGMISLPLINDIKAAGLTPMQLAADITDKLKKYLSDPHVTVTVTQMNSQRIYAMGEVLHPGSINLLPNMTVLQRRTTRVPMIRGLFPQPPRPRSKTMLKTRRCRGWISQYLSPHSEGGVTSCLGCN